MMAGLVFVTVTGVILAIWWGVASQDAVRARLATQGAVPLVVTPTLVRPTVPDRFPLLAQVAAALPFTRDLDRLTTQAGWAGRSGEVFGYMLVLAVVGAVIGGVRVGHWLAAVVLAIVGAAIPIIYLRYRRVKRIEKFSEQFPDALDMMVRAMRAGYAMGAALQVVADEMPDPAGGEFKRLFEEISLGRPAGEALQNLYERVQTDDVRFFYAAVSIQREVGGNLAEILEKLSVVMRERFRILSYARVLSAQQKGTAYCVAASPFAFAIMFAVLSPGFFDPLLRSPIGPLLIVGALIMQFIGFLLLKRIADITV